MRDVDSVDDVSRESDNSQRPDGGIFFCLFLFFFAPTATRDRFAMSLALLLTPRGHSAAVVPRR